MHRDDTFIVCKRGDRRHRPQPCAFCGATAVALCDYIVTSERRLCSRSLCRKHVAETCGEADYCEEHTTEALRAARASLEAAL